MLVVSPFNRREALAKLLDDISIEYLKQEDCESYYISLKDIYYNRKELIKHYYSDIVTKILDINSNNSSIKDLGKLRANIELLYMNYTEYKSEHLDEPDLTECLRKLYDHISLEVAKLEYNEKIFKRNIEEAIFYKTEQKLSDRVDKIYKDIDKQAYVLEKKLNENEKSYITILGIFASFVVTFVGGLSFFSAVLSGISQISIYRLIIVILLLGFVLCSINFLLFWFIARIINNNDTEGLNRIYLFAIKIIGALFVICCLMWLFDGIKLRNRINELIDNNINTKETFINSEIVHIDNSVATESNIE